MLELGWYLLKNLKICSEREIFKLLTSKQLAKIINLKSDAALRKQRSKGRSLFPYTRVGRKIFYPANLIVKTLQQNMVDANLGKHA